MYVVFLCFTLSIYVFRICSYCSQVENKNTRYVCVCVWCFCDMAITTFISMCLTHRFYFSLKLSCFLHITHRTNIKPFYVYTEGILETSATLTVFFRLSLLHVARQPQPQSTKLNRKFSRRFSSNATVWSRTKNGEKKNIQFKAQKVIYSISLKDQGSKNVSLKKKKLHCKRIVSFCFRSPFDTVIRFSAVISLY